MFFDARARAAVEDGRMEGVTRGTVDSSGRLAEAGTCRIPNLVDGPYASGAFAILSNVKPMQARF